MTVGAILQATTELIRFTDQDGDSFAVPVSKVDIVRLCRNDVIIEYGGRGPDRAIRISSKMRDDAEKFFDGICKIMDLDDGD